MMRHQQLRVLLCNPIIFHLGDIEEYSLPPNTNTVTP